MKQGDIVVQVRGLGTLTSTHTAELNLPQQLVQKVAAGQAVDIEFRNIDQPVPGAVTQVRPGGINGTVTVDVQVNGALPQGIAPPTRVDGTITIGIIYNVLYIGRPIDAQANSDGSLFKIEPNAQSAMRVKVQYGATSVKMIQIKSGLRPGDRVILSDMSAYQKYDRVEVR